METRAAHLWEGLGPALPTGLCLPLPLPLLSVSQTRSPWGCASFLDAVKAQVHGLGGAVGQGR